jgi:DNA-binding transcriptional LysR family regulator
MDIESLRPFLALTQELNFTRAAARSYLSQPALSRRIRELEREVGEELFARDSHTVSLTPAGERFQRYAVQLLGLFDAGIADVRRGEDRPDGDELRVGLFHPAAGEHTGAVLAEYRRRAPATRVRIVDVGSLDVVTALSAEHVDVTLAWGPVGGLRVAARALFDDDRAVAVADGHPLAARSTVTVDDVRPFAVAAVDAPAWAGYWQDADHRHVDAASFEDALLAAASGAVVCWAPRSLRRFSRVVGLRYVPVVGAAPVPVTVACRRHESRAAVRSFVHVAEQVCRTPALLPPPSLPATLPRLRNAGRTSIAR